MKKGHTQRAPQNTIFSATVESNQIDWSKWWPFKRATGEALQQLNKRSRKQPSYPDNTKEATL